MTSKKNICDIWRIGVKIRQNPKRQNFTFRQNHSTRFIEPRLDYIFVFNYLQELVNYTDILPTISTDHTSVLISLSNDNSDNNCRVLENMKKLVPKINTSNEFLEEAQMKWEFLKYEIRKFTIDYSKGAAKIRKQRKIDLEQKLQNLRPLKKKGYFITIIKTN